MGDRGLNQEEKNLALAPSLDVYEWGKETPLLGKAGSHGNYSAPLTSTVPTRWWQLPCTLPGLLTLSVPADCTPGQHRWAPASLPQTHLLLQVCLPAPLGGRKRSEGPLGKLRQWNPHGIRVMVTWGGESPSQWASRRYWRGDSYVGTGDRLDHL